MARFTDLKDLKNDTQRMVSIRERVSQIIYEQMCKEFGDDFTRYIPKDIGITDNGSKVAKHTVVVDVGDVLDNEKYEVGACVEITVKTKKWNTVERKDGKIQYGVTLDEYDIVLKKMEEEEEE